jgi:hypothetical protein
MPVRPLRIEYCVQLAELGDAHGRLKLRHPEVEPRAGEGVVIAGPVRTIVVPVVVSGTAPISQCII